MATAEETFKNLQESSHKLLLNESNAAAPEDVREKALQYFDVSEKIYRKLQGFQNGHFEAFSRKTIKDQSLRKGLKTTVQRYETSWR